MPGANGVLIAVKQLVVPQPWSAGLISTAFPIPEDEVQGITTFLQEFCGHAASNGQLGAETFIQVEQSDDDECRRLYSERARQWMPELGLGVWPGREPPTTWSQEEFMELGPGKKLRSLMHQVLRITGSPQAASEAFTATLPFGPVLRVMMPGDGDSFLERAEALLLPPIKDPSFTCYPFFVPLFDAEALTSATPEQLENWFCGASTYVRESFEDEGILIVTREPLGPFLETLGGRLEPGQPSVWYVPR